MNPFNLSAVFAAIIAAAGVPRSDVEELAAEASRRFPDLGQAEAWFKAQLRERLDPSLNEATLKGLLEGGWDELKTGHPGYNPHHFGGV